MERTIGKEYANRVQREAFLKDMCVKSVTSSPTKKPSKRVTTMQMAT